MFIDSLRGLSNASKNILEVVSLELCCTSVINKLFIYSALSENAALW